MSFLLDTISRLSVSVATIGNHAKDVGGTGPGKFSRALFSPDVQAVIRDIDESEVGLFTLEEPPSVAELELPDPHIGRTKAVEATPLRKRRVQSRSKSEVDEYDPEVYAEAALKYLEKYQAVNTMPRARNEAIHILNRLEELRDGIETMRINLQEQPQQRPTSPRSQANQEQKRVRELQDKIAKLKQRKKALLDERASKHSPEIPSTSSGRRRASHIPVRHSISGSRLPTLMFKPKVETDPSRTSPGIYSPIPDSRQEISGDQEHRVTLYDVVTEEGEDEERNDDEDVNGENGDEVEDPEEAESQSPDDELGTPPSSQQKHVLEPEPDVELKEVASPSPPLSTPLASKAPLQSITTTDTDTGEGRTPSTLKQIGAPSTPVVKKSGGIKVTLEVETIVAKVWVSIADTMFPGHSGKPPLKAKDTIALLHNILLLPSAPPSPSTLSTLESQDNDSASSTSTPQQILTSHLLLTLLSATQMPEFRHAMLLQKLKDAVTEKVRSEGRGLGEKEVTRALYNCVAKKLLLIDRGGKGQVVRFNV